MKIQLLSFPGCPNADATREVLRAALLSAGLPADFDEVDVSAPGTPEPLRDWGSPTILIDGCDVVGGEPSGPSCRLYEGARGIPSAELVVLALREARDGQRQWLRSFAVLPGAALALLPAVSCPACLAAYTGVLSAMGLTFLANNRVLVPLIAAFLAIGIGSVAWSTRSHRRPGPLVLTIAGTVAVVAGRLLWNIPIALDAGVALLIAASLWNMWLKRPKGGIRSCDLDPARQV